MDKNAILIGLSAVSYTHLAKDVSQAMADRRIDGWDLQIASDIVRDGLGLELLSPSGDVAGEIFRCDADRSVSMTLWMQEIPAEILAWFRRSAPRELGGTYEDGTPVDWRQVP